MNHEVIDYAVKIEPVIVSVTGEIDKTSDRKRNLVSKKREVDSSFFGLDGFSAAVSLSVLSAAAAGWGRIRICVPICERPRVFVFPICLAPPRVARSFAASASSSNTGASLRREIL